ncbi:MAG TPA: ferritin-like protein [Kofleriaceae bacterium]|nr:ferritin-like protein [Kofleriaceae bacterium]
MKIRADIVPAIDRGGLPEVRRFLQAAIELEHATIPAYQTALYSIKPGTNAEAAAIVASVAREEMLHLAIAANVLNAIGGAPVLDKPGFIPVFPGPLPLGIGDLTVHLTKLTRGQVFDTFMAIEQPETRLALPVKEARLAPLLALHAAPPAPAPDFATIGQFYQAIMRKLRELGDGVFAHPSSPQVVDARWYPEDELFAVTDVASAVAALTVIVDEGEGTTRSPLETPHGRPAHYYRFAELVYARRLVVDATAPAGFAYAGAAVPLDPAGVWNLLADAKSVDYAPGSEARRLSDRFNYSYTTLLRTLHATFNGAPEQLDRAIPLMFEQKLLGGTLASTAIAGTDLTAAPTFEYTPLPV